MTQPRSLLSQVRRVALTLLVSAVSAAPVFAWPRDDPTPTVSRDPWPEKMGFFTLAEVQPLVEAFEGRRYADVQRLANALLGRGATTFSSPRRERNAKASALYFRGRASAAQGDTAGALKDFQKSTELGYREAAYQAGRIVFLLASEEMTAERASHLKERMKAFFEMGAELGDADCIGLLRDLHFRENPWSVDAHYWFLLELMAEGPEKIRWFDQLYRGKDLDDRDRSFFAAAMRQKSLSGGEAASPIPGLPGRSTFTAAYVDYVLRRRLEFVWRAFFADRLPSDDVQPLARYRSFRELIVSQNPMVDLFFLVHTDVPSKENGVVGLNRQDLAKALLPGDEIIVRTGRLTHQATVWKVNEAEDRLLLLDPFHEFWQPGINFGVRTFSLVPYKYQRELVSLKRTEVAALLEAVIAIRDRKPSK